MLDVQNEDPAEGRTYSLRRSTHEALRRIANTYRNPNYSLFVAEAVEEWLAREFGPQWDDPEALDRQIPLWKQRRREPNLR